MFIPFSDETGHISRRNSRKIASLYLGYIYVLDYVGRVYMLSWTVWNVCLFCVGLCGPYVCFELDYVERMFVLCWTMWNVCLFCVGLCGTYVCFVLDYVERMSVLSWTM